MLVANSEASIHKIYHFLQQDEKMLRK